MPLSGFRVSTFCVRIMVHDLSRLCDKPTVSFISIFPRFICKRTSSVIFSNFSNIEKLFLESEVLLKDLIENELKRRSQFHSSPGTHLMDGEKKKQTTKLFS